MDIKPLNIENEDRFLACAMRFPEFLSYIKREYLSNMLNKAIFDSIDKLYTAQVTVSLENIKFETKSINKNINTDDVEDIYNKFKDVDVKDIAYIAKTVKSYYISHVQTTALLDKVAINLQETGTLPVEETVELCYDIIESLSGLNEESILKDTNELTNIYDNVIKERAEGVKVHSLGFSALDKKIYFPAHPKQITILFSTTGGGKSIFTKSIENKLLNKRIPILSINPEMDAEQTMDRLMCMRESVPVSMLIQKEKPEETMAKIKRFLDELKTYDNYYFVEEPSLSISDVDSLIYMAKRKFKEKGVIKSLDDYIFTSIDLLSMLTDFSGADTATIENNMNKLHTMYRRHNSHLFAVLQDNDSPFRQNILKIKEPDDCNYVKLGLEHIKWGRSWAERARVVISMTRPLELKRRFFPAQMEEWDLERDIINTHIIKQNTGKLGYLQFIFDTNTFAISHYNAKEENAL